LSKAFSASVVVFILAFLTEFLITKHLAISTCYLEKNSSEQTWRTCSACLMSNFPAIRSKESSLAYWEKEGVSGLST
jgi:hypothetical protein